MAVEDNVIVFEIPASLDADALVDGLPASFPATTLRSGVLATTITVTLELISATSGVVQIFVARQELAEFGHRLLSRIRDQPRSNGGTVTLKSDAKTTALDLSAEDADEQFVQSVEELSSAEPPEARP